MLVGGPAGLAGLSTGCWGRVIHASVVVDTTASVVVVWDNVGDDDEAVTIPMM